MQSLWQFEFETPALRFWFKICTTEKTQVHISIESQKLLSNFPLSSKFNPHLRSTGWISTLQTEIQSPLKYDLLAECFKHQTQDLPLNPNWNTMTIFTNNSLYTFTYSGYFQNCSLRTGVVLLANPKSNWHQDPLVQG